MPVVDCNIFPNYLLSRRGKDYLTHCYMTCSASLQASFPSFFTKILSFCNRKAYKHKFALANKMN